MAREVTRSEMVLGDDWGEAIPVYGGRSITIIVGAQPCEVQLSSDQPPNPPRWADAVRMVPGDYSRGRAFGYVRFRNAVRGAPSVVSFWAHAA